jgi:hypothetical protein
MCVKVDNTGGRAVLGGLSITGIIDFNPADDIEFLLSCLLYGVCW